MRKWMIAAAMLAACTEETENASCTEDFECTVGQVCGDDGLCADASPGTERTFGKADLDFASGNETYLVSVYALPTAAEAADDGFVNFKLSAGGTETEGQALTLAPPAQAERAVDPMLVARSAFESERRAQIDALVANLRAGTRRLERSSRAVTACAEDCGPTEMCWKGECTAEVTLNFLSASDTVTCDLVSVVTDGDITINVLVDQDDSADESIAIDAATTFAATLVREQEILGLTAGHSGALDKDQDGRLTVVFTNAEAGGVTTANVGFFDFHDFLAEGTTDASGNEADLLWVRTQPDSGEITTALALGTLAHEYVHLTSFALRVDARGEGALRETLWLDEAMAHTMEDLSGYGPSNVAYVAEALGMWNDGQFAGPNDTNDQRGRAYLLLRHVIDEAARAAGATGATDSQVFAAAKTLYTTLLSEETAGYEHSVFANQDFIGTMQLASYASGNDAVTVSAANAHDFLTPEEDTTGNLGGIAAVGDFVDARGGDVSLSPDLPDDELSGDLSSPFEDQTYIGGAKTFLVTGGTGLVSMVGTGASEIDFRIFVQKVAE